jgi:hypothetical protein
MRIPFVEKSLEAEWVVIGKQSRWKVDGCLKECMAFLAALKRVPTRSQWTEQ